MMKVYDQTDDPRFHAMLTAGYEYEVEGYGISDGMHRRAPEPAYAHEPPYLAGYRTGLALPAERAL